MSTPYGEWPSPVAPEDVAAEVRSFATVTTDGDHVYWLERRPSEAGRGVVCRAPLGGSDDGFEELTPASLDVRTLVHQYGGGDLLVADGTLLVASMDDQRLYRLPADGSAEPTPVTPEPPELMGYRFADMRLAPDGETVYAVRERHVGPGADAEPANELVRFPLRPAGGDDANRNNDANSANDADEASDTSDTSNDPTVVAEGHDFYAAPRLAPGGDRIAYLRWDHPNMPWDGTELVVARVDDAGALRDGRVVAGGPAESVVSPKWSPAGVLHAVSDRTGWWNLYRFPDAGEPDPSPPENLHPAEAAFGVPMWQLGMSTFAFLDDGRIATLVTEGGEPSLRLLDPGTGDLVDPELPYTSFRPVSFRSDGDHVVFAGHRTDAPSAVVEWAPSRGRDGHRVRESTDDPLDPDYVSEPEPIVFPTGDAVGATETKAYAHYYPPHNPDAEAPADEAPPLLVRVHGGPTSRSEAALSATVQFWTTRGVGVLAVNYRGSTGYGRAFREALDGEWGVRDTLDCVNAARYAAETGLADGERLAISGGSAGGYAVLCALAFHDAFDAGASYYGVADLRALAEETHKFESRYLDGLVGPLPEAADVYEARSPVSHADGITAPLLILQGGRDEVVPPAQAEAMIDALVANGTPYAYVAFPEARHGFREADNVARAHEAELAFYGEAFGFEPAGDVESVEVFVGERPG